MRLTCLPCLIVLCLPYAVLAQKPAPNYLAGNTVLIVRHAEKPESGRDLTPSGEARARAYSLYFEPFHERGWNIRVDALFAGADSENSVRPRLTLEPMSKATGLKLDASIGTKQPEKLVELLRSEVHGTHPLIAWRHGEIPDLMRAFGASATLIPGNKWPDNVYDWVIILKFNQDGVVERQDLIQEHLDVR